jgi:hypothetical protein
MAKIVSPLSWMKQTFNPREDVYAAVGFLGPHELDFLLRAAELQQNQRVSTALRAVENYAAYLNQRITANRRVSARPRKSK